MTRRTRHHGPPRCGHCDAVVVWFRSALTGRWRTFEPKAVDARHWAGRPALPVENNARWWHLNDLVEDLMVRRECSNEDAYTEAYDMPWHLPHDCSGGDGEELGLGA